MELLFYLSGENPKLAETEVCYIFETYKVPYKRIFFEKQIAIFKGNFFPELKRLALTKKIVQTRNFELDPEKTFRVRCKSFNSKIFSFEKRIADKIQREFGKMKVSLDNPDQEIFCVFINENKFLGKTLISFEKKEFEKRRPQNRPFFHPTSIHPKYARLIVNLARARFEVLDCFCGTGGVLIEAGLMGLKVFGLDVSEKMVQGCEKNLKHFGIEGKIIKGDASNLSKYFEDIESVATDVPYGKSSLKKGKDLYETAFLEVRKVCKKACIVTNKPFDFEELGFKVLEVFKMRIHKSLVRYFYVLE